MGGGDLNMKKSFHPNTMKNLERVFNAELKRDTEMKKVEQLRREIAEERQREDMHRQAVETGVIKGKAARLDWMYSGPGAAASSEDREEYLLGKKIDKEVDPLQTKEDTTDSASASLFTDVTLSGANSQRDTAAKIREDPLFAIKKQEEQARKNLMSNPVRLKQLQHMLRAQAGSDDKKKKKKKKKDKHRDADVHHDRRSDDEEWSRHSHRHEEGRTRHDDDRTRHHRHSEDRTRYDDDRTHRQHYDRDRTHQRRYNEDITRRHRHDEDRTHHDQDTARHHLHGDDMTRRHHRHEDKSRHDEDRPTSARRGEDERPHRRRSRSRSPLDHAASSRYVLEYRTESVPAIHQYCT